MNIAKKLFIKTKRNINNFIEGVKTEYYREKLISESKSIKTAAQAFYIMETGGVIYFIPNNLSQSFYIMKGETPRTIKTFTPKMEARNVEFNNVKNDEDFKNRFTDFFNGFLAYEDQGAIVRSAVPRMEFINTTESKNAIDLKADLSMDRDDTKNTRSIQA